MKLGDCHPSGEWFDYALWDDRPVINGAWRSEFTRQVEENKARGIWQYMILREVKIEAFTGTGISIDVLSYAEFSVVIDGKIYWSYPATLLWTWHKVEKPLLLYKEHPILAKVDWVEPTRPKPKRLRLFLKGEAGREIRS
jgi:hypothetical protein